MRKVKNVVVREYLNLNVVLFQQKREVVVLKDCCVEEAEVECENRRKLTQTRVGHDLQLLIYSHYFRLFWM